ncbi:hypothetical protein COI_1526 [Mannheimia haemolytica serotype A2 str. OVINE]|nr:hypothetical protein COI_1526 [Mannheimia haemolytica serotype A2 str. OVINE]
MYRSLCRHCSPRKSFFFQKELQMILLWRCHTLWRCPTLRRCHTLWRCHTPKHFLNVLGCSLFQYSRQVYLQRLFQMWLWL